MATKTYAEELNEIAAACGGTLHPEAVVEYARDPETTLHGRFTWDDTEAAALYRIQQAQHVIRCHVIQLPNENSEPVRVRAFVSLPSSRPSHVYHRTEDVLANQTWRRELLTSALSDLRALKRKYGVLGELAGVFAEAERLEQGGSEAA